MVVLDGADAATVEGGRLVRLRARAKEWRSKFTLAEVSGSLGDLGIYIPLLVGLTQQGSVFFVPSLFFAGFFNFVTGIAWDVPMCVQPMKTIAAVALAEDLPTNQVAAAGILVSAMVFFLGFTRLIDVVNKAVPMAVIYGMQLGLGFSLMRKGMNLILATRQYAMQPDCYVTAWLCGILAIYLQFHRKRAPTALILFFIGLIMAIERMARIGSPFSFKPEWPVHYALGGLSANDWLYALGDAALPQLPLTTLNSVVSVCHLSKELFPEKKVPQRDVAISVGAMNVFCIVGAMPCCHGAGGLAAQHHFGARTGASMLFLGFTKMVLAIAVGTPLNLLLTEFPGSVLGIMLVLSGLELAKQGKKLKDEPNLTVGYITAIVTLTLKTGIACIAGIAAALLMGGAEQLYAWFKEEWPKWMAKLSSKRGRFSNVKADECDSPPTPPAQDSPFSDATEGHDAQEAKPLS